MQERLEAFEEDIYMFSTLPPFAAVNYLRKAMEYDRFLYEYAMDKHMRPEDLTELTDTIQESARPFQTWEGMAGRYRKVRRAIESGRISYGKQRLGWSCSFDDAWRQRSGV